MSIIEKALNKSKSNELDIISIINKDSMQTENTSILLTVDEAENTLTVEPIITEDEENYIFNFDWKRLSGLGFATPGNSNTETIEEYRNLKHPLINNAFGNGSEGITRSNLILITSSLPGEGKTFTAINLALSIANERDKKVLLIDADVARPSISKVLGINKTPGLIDYLDGTGINLADIIIRTSIPDLSIIPAGKLHDYSTELLSSNKMILLLEELSNRYPDRIVIFDSPPLLAATQAEVLAKLVGQVVLVIEAEKTLQNVVMESVAKLATCDVVLAVFNKTKKNMDLNYYGYGYGYGHYAH